MHLMNFIGLIQYLTPAILTGSLDCQHAQIFYGKLSIVVSPCGRKRKSGFITFCDGLRRKVSQAVLNE